MSLRRRLSWSTAMRDLRRDRALHDHAKGLTAQAIATARLRDAVTLARSRPLRNAAGFNRSAIMAYALALARQEQAKEPRRPWRKLMAAALRTAWDRARYAPVQVGEAPSVPPSSEARP